MKPQGEKLHVLFTDGAGDYRVLGEEFLTSDGHCSVSRDEQWMVTDENSREALVAVPFADRAGHGVSPDADAGTAVFE
jgi:hypothetical protein